MEYLLIGTAAVLCLLSMEPMVPHLLGTMLLPGILRLPCATRTPVVLPSGYGIPHGLYAVSRTSFRPPHYYPGLASRLAMVLAPPRQVDSWYTISGVMLLRVTGPLHTLYS